MAETEEKKETKRPPVVTILRPIEEVYNFFKDFSNLPRFLEDLDRVESKGEGRHIWYAKGEHQGLETEIFAIEAPSLISWRSKGIGEASVLFQPALEGRATEVYIQLAAPSMATKVLDFFQRFKGEDTYTSVYRGLRRMKALLEAGEIPTTEGQPSGRESAAAA